MEWKMRDLPSKPSSSSKFPLAMACLAKKSQRSFEILAMRSEGKTLEELGRAYELTRERIRQVEKKMQLYLAKY